MNYNLSFVEMIAKQASDRTLFVPPDVWHDVAFSRRLGLDAVAVQGQHGDGLDPACCG